MKAAKVLKGKKLDAFVDQLFYKHGNRIQFNILNLGKISQAGRDGYASGGEEGAEAGVIAAIAKYREN